MGLMRQSLLKRLCTTRNDDPGSACRPFDVDRSGTVISEGAGLVVIEELKHARQRGAKIYAELVGFGASSNPHSWMEPHPEGLPIQQAARMAIQDAGIGTDDIDAVGAFGIGTQEHDLSEAKAIRGLFDKRTADLPVIAIKGAIGNNGAGSGAIDFAALTMALHHRTLPASLNTDKVDPACGLHVVVGDPVDAKVDHAVSLSYAMNGGQNAALVIKRIEE
jgi:3-oxoacyl-[acyl-carrier-protein] synthase II